MKKGARIVASVLGADYSRLGREVADLARVGVDAIQWDIMDGRFVPALTFGPTVVAACRDSADIPFEAHLMVERPEAHIAEFIEAGCTTVIVHAEAVADAASAIDAIHGLGGKAGLALSPGTPLASVDDVLDGLDQLLIMTVQPGAGGQAYLTDMERKISDARRFIDRTGALTRIEVDGGITPQTIWRASRAGADVFVAGSFILGHTQGKAAALERLRQAVAASPRSN